MDKSKYRPAGKGYLYVNEEKVLKIDNNYIMDLKEKAKSNGYNRCMMCLHDDIRNHVHEMINVFAKHEYIQPHCHPFKTETKSIIEGRILMIIYDEAGNILEEFVMSKDEGHVFTVRIEQGIFHTNIALTDSVFQETITGPFVGKDDSVYPEWAPSPDDVLSVQKYMEHLDLDRYE